MGLNHLIKNLDSYTKTELLGLETTRILRLTFSNNEFDALDDSIVNEALTIQRGSEMIQNSALRSKLVDALKKEQLQSLGIRSYQDALNRYRDLDLFVRDFKIEAEFLLKAPIDDRTNIEIINPKHNDNVRIAAYPHEYQKRLKDQLLSRLLESNQQKILTSMPTGAGKTVLAMELIVDLIRISKALQSKSLQIVWLVSSKELAEQSLQSFKKIWNQKGDHPVRCQRFFGKFDSIEVTTTSTVTFATFDLLVSRLDATNSIKLLESTDFLFIDEAHHSEAYTYEKVLLRYQHLNPKFNIIGLTATPFRSEDTEFDHFKQIFNHFVQLTNEKLEIVDSPIQHLIKGQYLAQIDYRILNNSEGNVSEAEYYRTLNNAVLQECRGLIERKENTIIFAKSKSHAIALSIFLKREGLNNGLIVGETPDVMRKKLLSDFADKENDLNILINHLILSTGIDVPGMNSIMILGDVNSPSLGLQILGRAMRGPKNGGNEQNTIYLTKQNYDRLSDYKLLETIVLN
jgi:superfamily II DNA or RNA helicase